MFKAHSLFEVWIHERSFWWCLGCLIAPMNSQSLMPYIFSKVDIQFVSFYKSNEVIDEPFKFPLSNDWSGLQINLLTNFPQRNWQEFDLFHNIGPETLSLPDQLIDQILEYNISMFDYCWFECPIEEGKEGKSKKCIEPQFMRPGVNWLVKGSWDRLLKFI